VRPMMGIFSRFNFLEEDELATDRRMRQLAKENEARAALLEREAAARAERKARERHNAEVDRLHGHPPADRRDVAGQGRTFMRREQAEARAAAIAHRSQHQQQESRWRKQQRNERAAAAEVQVPTFMQAYHEARRLRSGRHGINIARAHAGFKRLVIPSIERPMSSPLMSQRSPQLSPRPKSADAAPSSRCTEHTSHGSPVVEAGLLPPLTRACCGRARHPHKRGENQKGGSPSCCADRQIALKPHEPSEPKAARARRSRGRGGTTTISLNQPAVTESECESPARSYNDTAVLTTASNGRRIGKLYLRRHAQLRAPLFHVRELLQ